MSKNRYFEEIGAWPSRSKGIARMYVAGFLLSLALSFAAYVLATGHDLSHYAAIAALITLALVQFAVQLALFLHMSGDAASRARLVAFGGAMTIVFILIGGSLWIMFDLNQRMMPSQQQMDQYMQSQDGI